MEYYIEAIQGLSKGNFDQFLHLFPLPKHVLIEMHLTLADLCPCVASTSLCLPANQALIVFQLFQYRPRFKRALRASPLH